MLRPIGFQSLDEAMPVLARGFPAAPRSFWESGLARLKRYGATDSTKRTGYLLQAEGNDVGVILAIPSAREQDGQRYPVVNLSSWYIDERHRWRGPRMLQQVVSCETTLYTDLTPTEPVRAMIGRFGFRNWTEGTLIFMLPFQALKPARKANVVPWHKLPSDAFAPAIRRMLDDHAALGCTPAGLWDGERLHPLIFSRTQRRGVPIARLIYAESRSLVKTHMGAIARFLLREKFLLMAMNANAQERVAGSFFTGWPAPAFFKGKTAPPECDLAYSEFVFLQI
ncbi:hypothetical protein [Pseudorhodoplanes sinuspersici]|uniref:Uncharacterized protein n=1 Tax=Pseudorhodoplanes sinuspersici TaxID=1235591 RepID=A0A1W6ZQR4_9HYPH|nr:hypothetical protein [Pseudorhodoplanes sinuspersici]ARP99711.1 hypothetical protein CAK95_11880 [Pseudorhodoplanes sinuspersici]RKE70694.1 hypothetical protein DFP91_2936 [Pseudorhodoplanes sinuspersici]